jgi:hypothetical protein
MLEKVTFLIFKLPFTVPAPWADDLKASLIRVYKKEVAYSPAYSFSLPFRR